MSAPLLDSPVLPVLSVSQWDGIEFRVTREDISSGTDWAINEPQHAVIVHLGGAIHQLETELEGCGNLLDPPMPGEVWLIPASRSYASQARGNVVDYAEFYLQPEYWQQLCGRTVDAAALQPQAGRYDEFLHVTAQRLVSLHTQTDDVSRLLCQSLSQAVGLYVLKDYAASSSIQPHTNGLTATTRNLLEDYIAAHLSYTIALNDLAKLSGLTTHQLLISFRRSFGTTPAQYLIAQRLRRARWLLTHTAKDITTISLETGFASHSHLTTTFKKHVGLTPQAFRQRQ